MADNATSPEGHNDLNGSVAASVVMEAMQLSNDLAENLGQAGVNFRTAMGWDVQGNEGINAALIGQHLEVYEQEIGKWIESIIRLTESLPVADEVAFTSVKGNIPPDLTVVQALEGNLIPANETIETIADWFNSIDDNLDVLYAESLFAQVLISQEDIQAPQATSLNEEVTLLLETVGPNRESLGHILSYFE